MTAVNKIIVKIISLVLLAACLTVLFTSMALARRDQTIYPSNVTVGGVSIANLNHEEAQARLQAEKDKWPSTLQLKIDKNNAIYSLPLSELKINYDLDSSLKKTDQYLDKSSLLQHTIMRGAANKIAPVLNVEDRSLLYNKLAEMKKNLDQPATNARILYKQGCLEYVEHRNGYAVDLDASLKFVENELENGSLGPITLVTKDLYPKVKIEDIKMITDLIGVAMIGLQPGTSQNDIAKQLLASLDGIIVMPGDQFSMQTEVDKQLSDYKKNRLEYKQTLHMFNEALLSACRSAHLDIGCTDPGKLVFSNNLGKPLMLSLAFEGNELAVKIFGCQTEEGKEISLIKEQTVISPEVEVQVDEKLMNGERNVIAGQEGKTVRTFRLVKINGKKIEKKLLSEEVFPPKNTIMKVPPDTVIK